MWRGYWTLSEYKLRKMVSKTCRGVTFRESRQPLRWFLEWPLWQGNRYLQTISAGFVIEMPAVLDNYNQQIFLCNNTNFLVPRCPNYVTFTAFLNLVYNNITPFTIQYKSSIITIPQEMKNFIEFNLATWLRLVKFTELNISKFWVLNFDYNKLSLRVSEKYIYERNLNLANFALVK